MTDNKDLGKVKEDKASGKVKETIDNVKDKAKDFVDNIKDGKIEIQTNKVEKLLGCALKSFFVICLMLKLHFSGNLA